MFFRKNKKNNIQNPNSSELNKSDNKINLEFSEIKSENNISPISQNLHITGTLY